MSVVSSPNQEIKPIQEPLALSELHIETLLFLYYHSPIWCGDLPSKVTRDELETWGLVSYKTINGVDGFWAITEIGKTRLELHFGTVSKFLEAHKKFEEERQKRIEYNKNSNSFDPVLQNYVPQNLIGVVVKNFEDSNAARMASYIFEENGSLFHGISNGFENIRDELFYLSNAKFPTIDIPEKYGKPISNFIHRWVRSNETINVWFIEPDPTHTRVLDAWFCSLLKPTYFSGTGSKVVPNADGKCNIVFGCEMKHFLSDEFAEPQKILDDINANKNKQE